MSIANTDQAERWNFQQGDAQVHPFEPARFDAVISRFGVMFFADPVAAFANIRSATRPAGRLVFACWQPLAALAPYAGADGVRMGAAVWLVQATAS
jgi:SAM-dependent methyltransferase